MVRKRDTIFAKNLKKKYIEMYKSKGKTMSDLADDIGLSDYKSISNWINGYQYPSQDNMEILCDLLKTTEEELNTPVYNSFEDKYENDPIFTEDMINGFKLFSSGIGLNNDFLSFVRSTIPDKLFPKYTIINSQTILKDFDFKKVWVREQPLRAMKSTPKYAKYQLHIGDETYNLEYPDLAFLKDVQDEIISYIEYLFYKRKLEMENELSTVIEETTETDSEGRQFEKGMLPERLKEIDKYYKYISKDGEHKKIIEEQRKQEETNNA